jgi:hypothetical protein
MLRLADKMMKTLADVTVGSIIVLAHVAIADRRRTRVARAGEDRSQLDESSTSNVCVVPHQHGGS